MKAMNYILALMITVLPGLMPCNAQSAQSDYKRSCEFESHEHGDNQTGFIMEQAKPQYATRSIETMLIRESGKPVLTGQKCEHHMLISISNNENPRSKYSRPNETVLMREMNYKVLDLQVEDVK